MEDKLDFLEENANTDKDPLKNNSLEQNDSNLNIVNNKSTEIILDDNKQNSNLDNSVKDKNEKMGNSTSTEVKIKPKKEIPIEKKPFNEFINEHLLPSLIKEFKERGFEVEDINLKNTYRPIAGDKCWVIYCGIKDTCNFWLSFSSEDISSLKSISLSKYSQKPSVIESFLIDEKRITLKLIISRILQRLNGQKLIGVN